jgi:hypothetical protein
MNSLPPDQRTITTPVEDGVLREPIPGMEVCDFCAATPVEFAYPCGPISLGPNVTSDAWAACTSCHAMIETNDRDQLAHRALVSGGLPPEALPLLTELHRRFFAARLGPPTRV